MKKKPVLWTILIVFVVVIALVAVWGKQYYDNRYVGTDYYSMVPLDYDMTSVSMRDQSGKEIGAKGIDYQLTAYNEKGEAREISIIVYDPDSGYSRGEIQPQPGTYLWISASKQLVVRWGVIEEGDVPKTALEKIKSTK